MPTTVPSSRIRQLFGTDGIRGTANVHPITPELMLRLGAAVGHHLCEAGGDRRAHPSAVVGKDTRISGGMLESAFAAGLASAGVDVALAGVIPTPAVAFLTRKLKANLGAVISASHNPYPDNGIKFFGPDGYKLDDEEELELESRVLEVRAAASAAPVTRGQVGRLATLQDAPEPYLEFALHTLTHGRTGDPGAPLGGVKIAIDNANGAAVRVCPEIFQRLGAECVLIHSEPNGININEDCGCTHPDAIRAAVRESGAHLGIAFDGDADRVLVCDENGEILDGDEIMAIAATTMIREGSLVENTLVTTVMSNCGLDDLLRSRGGKVVRARVGDRYVIEQMRAGGFNFGGEQSGHFIFHDLNTTGDGIISALQVLRIMVESGEPLGALKQVLTKYPQAQRNLAIKAKPPLEELTEAAALISETEQNLGDAGRVLLRYSGTEPVIRLLVEGKDAAYIQGRADEIAGAISSAIGA